MVQWLHEAILASTSSMPCKAQDFKRRNWVTTENFQNMYDNIYKEMVKSGVAVLLDEEIMYDENGLETDDVEKNLVVQHGINLPNQKW